MRAPRSTAIRCSSKVAIVAVGISLALAPLALRAPFVGFCLVIGLLGAAHGYTHRTEIVGVYGLAFGAGLFVVVAILQGVGVLLGFALGSPPPSAKGILAALTFMVGLIAAIS